MSDDVRSRADADLAGSVRWALDHCEAGVMPVGGVMSLRAALLAYNESRAALAVAPATAPKSKENPVNDIPRRIRIDLQTPIEAAIRAARDAVDAGPAHPHMTRATVMLGQALDAVADFVDGVPERAAPPAPGDAAAVALLADARKCVALANTNGYYDVWLARCDRVIAAATHAAKESRSDDRPAKGKGGA